MNILNFLSGNGLFLVLALVLVIIYIYNRTKNRR